MKQLRSSEQPDLKGIPEYSQLTFKSDRRPPGSRLVMPLWVNPLEANCMNDFCVQARLGKDINLASSESRNWYGTLEAALLVKESR